MNKGKSLVNKRDAEYNFSKFKNAPMFVNRTIRIDRGKYKKRKL